jgi:hypothetical protein
MVEKFREIKMVVMLNGSAMLKVHWRAKAEI